MLKLLRNFTLFVVVLHTATTALAYDFEVDGLYFKIESTADRTCSVTYQKAQSKGDTWIYENDYPNSDLVIPSTVQYLGQSLKVIKIDRNAFQGNGNIQSVTIPSSIIYLDYSCFAQCTNLNNLIIEESDSPLICSSYRYFYGTPLKKAYVGRELQYQDIDENTWGWNCSIFANNSSIEEIEISSNLTTIHQAMFISCSNLKKINLHSSNVQIGKQAFSGCTNLIELGDISNIATIGDKAFEKCSSLSQLNFSALEALGINVFQGCSNLHSIHIGGPLLSIPEYCFDGCASLQDFLIPTSVTLIDNYAFNGCSSLTSMSIPGAVQSINNSAFAGCSSLSTFTIEEGEKTLNVTWSDYPSKYPYKFIWGTQYNSTITDFIINRPFSGALYFDSVQRLSIGEQVTALYSDLDLNKDANLSEIFCYSAVAPSWCPSVTNNHLMTTKVYVPKGSLQSYLDSDYWKRFWNLEESEALSAITPTIIEDATSTPSFYLLNGLRVNEEPSHGIFIRKQGNNVTKVVK